MPKKYYLDACIWLDYLEDRKDKFRPLGDWAATLIRNITESQEKIIISEHLMNELRNRIGESAARKMLSIVPKNLVEYVIGNKGYNTKASKIMRMFDIPFCDALHLAIAKENNAVLVTRDKHFENIHRIAEIRKPEELI